MDADKRGQNRERELISFPRWADVLAADGTIPAERREAYRCAIIAFLGFCKRRHAGASVILIQSYLSGLPEQARSGAREALRWWYRAAQGGGRSPVAGARCAVAGIQWAVDGGLWSVDGGQSTVEGGQSTVDGGRLPVERREGDGGRSAVQQNLRHVVPTSGRSAVQHSCPRQNLWESPARRACEWTGADARALCISIRLPMQSLAGAQFRSITRPSRLATKRHEKPRKRGSFLCVFVPLRGHGLFAALPYGRTVPLVFISVLCACEWTGGGGR